MEPNNDPDIFKRPRHDRQQSGQLQLCSRRKKPCQHLKKLRKAKQSNLAECGKQLSTPLRNVTSPPTPLPNFTSPPPLPNVTSPPPLIIVSDNEVQPEREEKILGRRIVDLQYFIEQIQKIDDHTQYGCNCNFKDMDIMEVEERGLVCNIWFQCKMCDKVAKISNVEENEKMDIETSAVSSAIAAGIGCKQLETVLGGLDIPPISEKKFIQIQDNVYDAWKKVALQLMKEAAEEEKNAAIERGDIDPRDGVPLITVIADGCWSKRSYRTGYSALSGVGAIIGNHTKKVLYIGVRNKYCVICKRAENKGIEVRQHTCFKNWDKSSSQMEANSITEGFLESEEMYGLRYTKLIGDGDSNVHKSIVDSCPYAINDIEKIECRNHLLRNFTSKLRKVSETKGVPGYIRHAMKKNVLKIRTGIVSAIKHWKSSKNKRAEKLMNLKKDIINCPDHTFGNHSNCAQYFCEKQTIVDSLELISGMKIQGVWLELQKLVNNLSEECKSLLYNVDSNPAEIFNAVVAKFVGGKRINYTQRQSYEGRCNAAAASLNSEGRPLYNLHKMMYKSSPGKYCKRIEEKNRKKMLYTRNRLKNVGRFAKKGLFVDKDTSGYGPNCAKLDITDDNFEVLKNLLLNELKEFQSKKDEIEKETRDQSESLTWMNLHKKLLTASIFGKIYKRRDTTSCSSTVKQILYPEKKKIPSLIYGKRCEPLAKKQLKDEYSYNIVNCGIFISEEYSFLGASPDGLINEDTVVEIKCPYSCKSLTPEEGLVEKKIDYWKLDVKTNKYIFNESHQYYYQVQGQLAITNRQFCVFCCWTPKGIKIDTIVRNNKLWTEKMVPKLKNFYFDCLLPEIIDPRHTRSMPIRDPSYIQEAIKKLKQKKEK